jgi:hypothetical protein
MDANAGGSATVGQADLLLSLKGDERRNLYLDPQAAYGTDEQWYTDLGLGYRWIQNDAAILGGYIFAGHSQVANQSGFWIANPGVEALGSRWDARINGYIPVGGRSDDLGVFQLSQSSQFIFTGHTANLVTTSVSGNKSQQIGDGVDARVGYQVLRGLPLKAYLGAYYFSIPHTNNVRGGAAGLEYWMDHNVKVFANYTYDNLQHNTVVGGLAVSFGGVDESRADPSLSERLTDPVQRYLANLGHGSGIPSETLLTNLRSITSTRRASLTPGALAGSALQPIVGNVAFFAQTGTPNNGGVGLTLANCTFENPCGPSDFSQTGVNTLNSLLPNTEMLFNGGTYNATNGSSALTLSNGQGVFGTTANYSAPASGAARSGFNGAFILTGNNTLDSIILNNSLGPKTVAISSTGGQNLLINNTTITSAAILYPYGAALNLTNASATLHQSSVNVNVAITASPVAATGISLTNSSLLVQSSAINVTGNSLQSNVGILLSNNSVLQFIGSQLTMNTNFLGFLGQNVAVYGITAQNNSMASISSNSTVNITGINYSMAYTSGLAGADTSSISMNGGSLTVSNNPLGGNAELTSNTDLTQNVTLTGVSCTLNNVMGC